MKKKLLASLTVMALSLGTTAAQAAIQSCDDPISSAIGDRFCFEKFENLAPSAYNVSFEYQAVKFPVKSDMTLAFGFLFDSQSHDVTRGLLSDTTAGPFAWKTYSFLTHAAGDAGLLFALRGSPGSSYGIAFQNFQVTAVPEPASIAMLLAGLGAIVFVGRRRRRL
jgi:hypothetical protein